MGTLIATVAPSSVAWNAAGRILLQGYLSFNRPATQLRLSHLTSRT